ncbi:DNA/RNA polymerases superfamily protein [Gossypium australe]|uniref:DNA/RNA polymerases superfamily protein n=1 Tax=Gossypium australe TaxID=47621 RepID=A0A5B6X408_9ROSI|nr:DNA/RNA polymerases superfamily protein [Gossypium australe]
MKSFGSRERLKVAFDRQKSYIDLKRKDVEYNVDSQVFVIVSPWRKGKLSPRFIRPYQIFKRISQISYRFELPLELDRIYDIFHVSMLRCYYSDPPHIILIEEIEVNSEDKIFFKEGKTITLQKS